MVDRGRPLGVPAMPLVAHALDAHRAAHRLRQQCRVDPGVAGVVAAVEARAGDPDTVHLVLRQPERAGDPVAREMRLLRAGPQGGAVGARVDHGASRAHAGMRLKRPLVFRLDDPRGTGEGRIDLAGRNRHLALRDGRLRRCGRRVPPSLGKGGAAWDQANIGAPRLLATRRCLRANLPGLVLDASSLDATFAGMRS